ncbi:hypothetical protein LX92_04489, partial [Maribacter polysiphoniae]
RSGTAGPKKNPSLFPQTLEKNDPPGSIIDDNTVPMNSTGAN